LCVWTRENKKKRRRRRRRTGARINSPSPITPPLWGQDSIIIIIIPQLLTQALLSFFQPAGVMRVGIKKKLKGADIVLRALLEGVI
jgi:hypothetical protein